MSNEPRDRGQWDRKQVGEEGEAPRSTANDDATWDKEQMERDQPGDAADARDPQTADDSGALSGDGQPSGESHWDRVDNG